MRFSPVIGFSRGDWGRTLLIDTVTYGRNIGRNIELVIPEILVEDL